MGFLDGGKSEQIKYLEDERKKLWDRLIKVETEFNNFKKEIEKRTPEAEKEAKGHSKMASEFRNKIEEKHKEVEGFVAQIKDTLDTSDFIYKGLQKINSDVQEIKSHIQDSKSNVEELETDLNLKLGVLDSKILKVEEIFKKYPDLDDELSKIEEVVTTIEENKEKSELTLNEVNKKKKEIDTVYRSIYGYTQKDLASGLETKTEGLKDELENSYSELVTKLEEAEETLDNINNEFGEKYNLFENEFKDKYAAIVAEIAGLLPNALTAGLSSAFSKKKDDETLSSVELQKKFNLGIYFLIGISLIPLAISIYFIVDNVELIEVINRIPKVVLAIIPMYIPALWFTISASKKLNLSKRLIEEYAHKEVLSRTYEGLSTQIANIQDKDQSEELKFRLLTNFLQVTSENPGKLISNYNTSDHPVMEALEQSYKFQIAIDKLESIPGLGKIATILEKKTKRKIAEKAEKIDSNLSSDDSE